MTDANGNTATSTITIDITDDFRRRADINSVVEGGVVNGNVLTDGTDDVFGADGPTVAGQGVIGVRRGQRHLAAGDGGVGATVNGSLRYSDARRERLLQL